MKEIISEIKEYSLSIILYIIIGILIANNKGIIHLNINWNDVFDCYVGIISVIVAPYILYKILKYLLYSPNKGYDD